MKLLANLHLLDQEIISILDESEVFSQGQICQSFCVYNVICKHFVVSYRLSLTLKEFATCQIKKISRI